MSTCRYKIQYVDIKWKKTIPQAYIRNVCLSRKDCSIILFKIPQLVQKRRIFKKNSVLYLLLFLVELLKLLLVQYLRWVAQLIYLSL